MHFQSAFVKKCILKKWIFKSSSKHAFFKNAFFKMHLKNAFWKTCIFKSLSKHAFFQMHFKKCILENMHVEKRFKKCMFQNAFFKMHFNNMHFGKHAFWKALQNMHFSKCIGSEVPQQCTCVELILSPNRFIIWARGAHTCTLLSSFWPHTGLESGSRGAPNMQQCVHMNLGRDREMSTWPKWISLWVCLWSGKQSHSVIQNGAIC